MTAIGTREVDEISKAMPPNLDVLLVEQEVAASDTITALQVPPCPPRPRARPPAIDARRRGRW